MVKLAIVFSPLEKSLNAFNDLVGFAHLEFLRQPLNGIAVVFGIIATRPSLWRSLFRVTQRHHIFRNATGAIFAYQRNPVVHYDEVPEVGRAITDSAPSVEVTKGYLLVLLSEVIGQFFDNRTSDVLPSSSFFWMLFTPLRYKCPALIFVFSTALILSNLSWILPAPFVMSRLAAWSFYVSAMLRVNFFSMSFSINRRRYFYASLAVAFSSVFTQFGNRKLVQGFGCAAPGAVFFNRSIHSILVNANSHDVCGQGGTSAAFSRSYSLGHNRDYTAQLGGAQ